MHEIDDAAFCIAHRFVNDKPDGRPIKGSLQQFVVPLVVMLGRRILQGQEQLIR